jgi:hypothetical protein
LINSSPTGCLLFSSEAAALETEVARAREEELKLVSEQAEAVGELKISDSRPPPPYPGEGGLQIKEASASSAAKKKADDLDAYLLGALDSGDEGIGRFLMESCQVNFSVGLD